EPGVCRAVHAAPDLAGSGQFLVRCHLPRARIPPVRRARLPARLLRFSHDGGGMSRSERQVPFLDLRAAYGETRAETDEAVDRVLEAGWYIRGTEVDAFEREFAAYSGSRHCVGVSNGLDALSLVLRAWDIGPGDEVLVPSHTFIATWLAVAN